jgi:hypothetical protein
MEKVAEIAYNYESYSFKNGDERDDLLFSILFLLPS